MKKTHILLIIVLAGAIGILISTAGDASNYVGFTEAHEMATAGSKKEIHVVGELTKEEAHPVLRTTSPRRPPATVSCSWPISHLRIAEALQWI
jgi:cytochrome c-type biogenesis protein CcmE